MVLLATAALRRQASPWAGVSGIAIFETRYEGRLSAGISAPLPAGRAAHPPAGVPPAPGGLCSGHFCRKTMRCCIASSRFVPLEPSPAYLAWRWRHLSSGTAPTAAFAQLALACPRFH